MSTYARHPLVGRRIKLVRTDDPYTRLTPGVEGTVTFVDALGTVSAKWDDGSTLGLVDGHDQYELLPEAAPVTLDDAPRCSRCGSSSPGACGHEVTP